MQPPNLLIAYIGNFHHSWCTEVHLARELESLGHTVERFQEPSNPSMGARFLERLEQWVTTNGANLVMFTRTWGLPPETTQLWRRLEARGVTTCSYHLDLYVGLQREAGVDTDPFWTTQHVFTPDGDPVSAEFFKAHGINHHWSSPAVVSDECTPGIWRAEYDFDVVFVGSENYHPEWPWRPQLITFLRTRYGDRFRRFSGDQPEGPTRGQDLNDLYATARVVVGDSLCPPGHTRYWTDRYFETVGRGGFLIAPFVEGLQDFFVDGEHLRFYDRSDNPQADLEHIADLIDSYLDKPLVAKQTASQGQTHVAAHQTYKHRLAAAIETMGLVSFRPAVPIINKLELGSGYSPTAGFTHLDADPNCPDVDIVGQAWPLDLPDGSVGELRAVDVLEHLSYWDTPKILADWFRVLVPGGKLYVQVPDAHTIMRWYATAPDKLVERLPANLPQTPLAGAAWRLLGGHNDGVYVKNSEDWKFNAHYALFSERSLIQALEEAGFITDRIEVNGHPNLLAYAVKP